MNSPLQSGSIFDPGLKLMVAPESGAQTANLEAWIEVPKLNSLQKYYLAVACENWGYQSKRYGRREVQRILSPGSRSECRLWPGYVQIKIQVEPGDIVSGMNLLNNMFAEPVWMEETFRSELRTTSGWESIESPEWIPASNNSKPVQPAEAQSIWSSLVRQDRVHLLVTGRIDSRSVRSMWAGLRDQLPKVAPNLPAPYGARSELPPASGDNLMFEAKIPKQKLTTYLGLAAILGAGKQSTLFRVAREKLLLSYRQEAFLVPATDGFWFRIAIGSEGIGSEGSGEEKVQALQKAMVEDLNSLKAERLKVSFGLLRGILQNGAPIELIKGFDSLNSESWRFYHQIALGTPFESDLIVKECEDQKIEDWGKELGNFWQICNERRF